MPRRHTYAATRSTWSKEQLDLMEKLIEDARYRKSRVNWREYQYELGHPIASIQTMASRLRERRLNEHYREQNRIARTIADAVSGYVPSPRATAAGVTDDRRGRLAGAVNPPKLPQRLTLDSERISTTTQGLMFAAEMRDRIDHPHNITAGLLGDPPPGKSALDKMHMPPPPIPRDRGTRIRTITLATKPMRF